MRCNWTLISSQPVLPVYLSHNALNHGWKLASSEIHHDSTHVCVPLPLTITDEVPLDGGQLLFEAGKELVERPHKGLVGPEGRLGALLGAVGGSGARWARLRAVASHLVDEPLQPGHGLPIHGNVLQHRVQAVLQRTWTQRTAFFISQKI